ILARFEDDGLVVRERSASDARRQVVSLTAQGKKQFAQLDRRSAKDIHALLTRHSARAQRRALAAMDTITAMLDGNGLSENGSGPTLALRPPAAGEFGWVIERHGALYADEYRWDLSFEALVARIVADYLADHDPERESAWIAELGGEPVGCVFCVKRDDD